MADKTLDVYLNDHLAGATFGSDLARQLIAHGEGAPLGALMRRLAEEIEQDRQTLSDLIERLGRSKNPVKRATTWLAEKASRVKLTGMSSAEGELGTFLALDLDGLIARATSQREALEVSVWRQRNAPWAADPVDGGRDPRHRRHAGRHQLPPRGRLVSGLRRARDRPADLADSPPHRDGRRPARAGAVRRAGRARAGRGHPTWCTRRSSAPVPAERPR